MPAKVVPSEYGRPATAALAQAIVEAQRGEALAPVTVVIPSNFAGLAARRMLGSGVLGVAGVANVSFLTPFRLAELLSVGQLPGKRPLTSPVLGAAIRRALAANPLHFAAVRDHQATERALAATFAELSNVSAAGLAAIGAVRGDPGRVIDLYRAIVGHLGQFHHEADVARAATHRADLAQAVGPFGHVIWYLPGPLSGPLAQLLESVLALTPSTVIVATAGDPAADREVARALTAAGITSPAVARIDASGTEATSASPHPPLADHIISVTDADEEVRAVIREVVQLIDQGVAPDRIGIFHPVPDPYVRILEQQFAGAGLPANGPSRLRLGETIAGRVLSGALALGGERWRRDRVIALVSSGPLRHGGQPAQPGAWDAISRSAGVVGGINDWRAKLRNERHRLVAKRDRAIDAADLGTAAHLERECGDIDELTNFIDGLHDQLGVITAAQGWRARSQAATDLLHALLGPSNSHRWWPEQEQVAFESVEDALERLATLDEIEPSPSMAVFQRALSSELQVARRRSGRFGHGVVYGPLASAPGHDLDAVFILGCTEGLCPTPRREDVLLPDRVRRLTNGELPERLGQIGEQHRLFLAAIASAPQGRRWLFLPRGDLRSNRRSRPSRWLLPTASALAGKAVYSTDFENASPPGVHEVPSHAMALLQASHYTSVDERDVAAVYDYVRAGGEASSHPAVHRIERGLRAQVARRSDAFTEFDGNVSGAPCAGTTDLVLSASRLETWATCGFRYYLSYVLGLSERDDPDRTVELSALDRGSALHGVLERFMAEAVAAGPPPPHQPWSPADRARAAEIAADVFREYEQRGRTGRPIEWQTQRSDLIALVGEFLTADDRHRAATGATPAHFEWAFGSAGVDPLVLTLANGRVLRCKGSVDRIDSGPAGHRFIFDYKTGKGKDYTALDQGDPTKGGTMLQLGLYAEAVQQHFGATDVDTGYWMVNTEVAHKQHGYRWNRERRDRLIEVLSTIVDGIDDGVFPTNPGDWSSFRGTYEACAYCEFDSVCSRNRAEESDDKAGAPELGVRVALSPRSAVEATK